MWYENEGVCEIKAITNAQNVPFWTDKRLRRALVNNNDYDLVNRKRELKRQLLDIVANQTGNIFDENVLTIVWARRFAAYKRADLLLRDITRFLDLISRKISLFR